MKTDLKNVSKYLSFILRHKPEEIGLTLDEQGWAAIDDVIAKTTVHTLTRELIELVVETNDKQRFAINSEKSLIRANQGHSIDVDLGFVAVDPPEFLWHGTAQRFEESILEKGLIKQKRHHVHLTESQSVALSVGGRDGKPVLFKILSQQMHEAGYKFYKSTNNVWLVDAVPFQFLVRDDSISVNRP